MMRTTTKRRMMMALSIILPLRAKSLNPGGEVEEGSSMAASINCSEEILGEKKGF